MRADVRTDCFGSAAVMARGAVLPMRDDSDSSCLCALTVPYKFSMLIIPRGQDGCKRAEFLASYWQTRGFLLSGLRG